MEKLQLIVIAIFAVLQPFVGASILTKNGAKPPPPKFAFNPKLKSSEARLNTWTPDNGSNIWEHTGLYEGDIMTYSDVGRNGIINETNHWPNATVPFFIDEVDFSEKEIETILTAFQEYHNRTHIRFRPYVNEDKNWIIVKGNYSGCWSSVGMHEGGQVVNVNSPKCVQHGVVVHELLHALGFYHQQSASDRDEYVRINWENILDGHEHNFFAYNTSVVTSHGVTYDYGSVMHYSATAFTKNGLPTIEPLRCGPKLGQRKGLSEKDITKLNRMYEKVCVRRDEDKTREMDNTLNEFIKWFQKIIAKLIE